MATLDKLDVVQRLMTDKPAFHLNGEARWDALPGTLRWIHDSVRTGHATIETGVGASTVVFAAAGAKHTAISPAPAEHERVREYCEAIGVDHSQVTFVDGLSDDVLPVMLGKSRTLDVAFIDGAHSFPYPEVDWYYITRSLKVGGKLMLDDIPIPAVAPVFRHMQLEPNWHLEGIFDDRTAAFTLLAPPAPEDWSGQPFNKHYPDLSFISQPRRFFMKTDFHATQLRRAIGRRYPSLRRVYKHKS